MAGHQDAVRLDGQPDQSLGLVQGCGQRLLDENVLAGLERRRCQLGVRSDLRGDHDRLQLGVGENVTVVRRRAHLGVALRDLREPLGPAVAEELQRCLGEGVQVAGEIRPPVPGAHYRDLDRRVELLHALSRSGTGSWTARWSRFCTCGRSSASFSAICRPAVPSPNSVLRSYGPCATWSRIASAIAAWSCPTSTRFGPPLATLLARPDGHAGRPEERALAERRRRVPDHAVAVGHQLDEDLGRQVAEEVEAVRQPELAEAADPLGDVVGAGVDVRPEDERLHPDGGHRLERLVDLIDSLPVLGRDRVLHHQHERPLGVDRRAGAAELLEHLAPQPQIGARDEVDRRAADVEHPVRVLAHRDHPLAWRSPSPGSGRATAS